MISKKIVLIGLLVLVLALSGCPKNGNGNQNLEEQIRGNPAKYYKDFIQQARSLENYKASYKLEFDLSEGIDGLLTGLEMSLEETKHKNQSKSIMSMNMGFASTRMAGYSKNNKFVQCTETTGLGNTQLICSKTDKEAMQQIQDMTEMGLEKLEDFKAEYLGRERIAGRECHNFKITVNKEGLEQLSSESEGTAINTSLIPTSTYYSGMESIEMETCLDKETGMALSTEVNLFQHSELTGKTEKAMGFDLKVEELSFDTTQEDVEPAMDLALVKAECTENSVELTVVGLKDSINAVVDVHLGEEKHIEMIDSISFGEETVFTSIPKEPITSYLDIKVCKDGKCTEQTCWVGFDIENLDTGDFNISDLNLIEIPDLNLP